MSGFLLNIFNPEDGKKYKLFLSSEKDFNRAKTDMEFCQMLLRHSMLAEEPLAATAIEPVAEAGTQPDVEESESTDSLTSSSIWKYDSVIALIESMAVHMEDLSNPTKKKHVYKNIVNDLLSTGHSVTEISCQNKWKSLLRSYKTCKDNKNKTGRGPSRFLFFDKMDNLLGEKPSNACKHSLDSMVIEEEENAAEKENMPSTSNLTPEKGKKRKRNAENPIETLCKLRRELEEMKMKRHEDRMRMEAMKLEIEKDKSKLLKEYLEK